MRIGKLNLTWWRKRPPIHVAEYPNALVIDMSDVITILDPDRSAFSTMLMKLEGREKIEVKESQLSQYPVGAIVWVKGKPRRVVSIEDEDDWFKDTRTVIVRDPAQKFDSARKVLWLEDQLLPRTGALA